ncbi:MAG: argininosuccinate lyase, partial [Pyrinomonadaceae bacterium]
EVIVEELGFDGVINNSLDVISDRDFAVEFVSACSLLMMHLSRFAEDLILYSSQEFRFIEFAEPTNPKSKKKSRSALELIRGKAGKVFGHQISILTMLKALPSTYNEDLQEEKESIFNVAETAETCLQIATLLTKNIKLNKDIMLKAISEGYLNTSELADYLVNKGAEEAQQIAEKITLHAIRQGKSLQELSLEEMQRFSELIEEDIFKALSLEQSLASKNQIGGTSPERVAEALKTAKEDLEFEEKMQDKSRFEKLFG